MAANIEEIIKKFAEDEAIYQEAYENAMKEHGKDHKNTWKAMTELALNLQGQRKIIEATSLFEDVLDSKLRNLPEKDPELLSTLTDLAPLYQQLQELHKAIRVNSEILKYAKSIFGPDHPKTLIAMNNLGRSLFLNSQLTEAEGVLKECIELCKDRKDLDPELLLSSHEALASVYDAKGKYKNAEKMRKDLIQVYKIRNGENDKTTLSAMSELADTLHRSGNIVDAESLYLELVEKTETHLGKENEVTLLTLRNTALFFDEQQRYDLAESYATDLYSRTKQIHGIHENTIEEVKKEIHFDVLSTGNILAMILRNGGKLDEAIHHFQQLIEMMKQQLGENAFDTLITQSNVARCYMEQKNWKDAEIILLDTLKKFKESASSSSPQQQSDTNSENYSLPPDAIKVGYLLGEVYFHQEKYEEAEELYKKCNKFLKMQLGKKVYANHPDYLIRLPELARVFSAMGRFEEAEPLYADSLKQLRTICGDQHPYTLRTLELYQNHRKLMKNHPNGSK